MKAGVLTTRNLDNAPVKNIAVMTTGAQSVLWNDFVFQNSYLSKVPRKIRPNKAEAINHARVFLNSYYQGQVEEAGFIEAMSCLWFYTTVNGHFLIPEGMLGDDTWTAATNVAKLSSDVVTKPYFMPQKGVPSGTDKASQVNFDGPKPVSMSEEWMSQFYSVMWDMLGNTDDTDTAIHILSFLAGTLCRLVVKDPASVELHIVQLSRDRFNSVFSMTHGFSNFAPPNTGIYDFWESSLRKYSPQSNVVLATLVGALKLESDDANSDVRGALKAICLLSLSGVGLGELNWAQKAAEVCRVSLCEFLKRISVEAFHEICQNIYSFLLTVNNSGDQVFLFCKLFADGAYSALSAKNNPDFAMTCAAISPRKP